MPSDIISVLIFSVLSVIYLHRSMQPSVEDHPLWIYAVAVALCAGGDICMNNGRQLVGALLLLASVGALAWLSRSPSKASSDRRD